VSREEFVVVVQERDECSGRGPHSRVGGLRALERPMLLHDTNREWTTALGEPGVGIAVRRDEHDLDCRMILQRD